MCLFVAEGKREGSDSAEPSLEGPVGKTTGNRPLNNQSPVNPSVPSKTQDLVWASSRPAYTNVPFVRLYADTGLVRGRVGAGRFDQTLNYLGYLRQRLWFTQKSIGSGATCFGFRFGRSVGR